MPWISPLSNDEPRRPSSYSGEPSTVGPPCDSETPSTDAPRRCRFPPTSAAAVSGERSSGLSEGLSSKRTRILG